MIDCNPGTSVCPGFLIFKRTGRNQSGAVVRCVASVKLRMSGYESCFANFMKKIVDLRMTDP
jgi:hypothetical protein